MGDGTDNTVNQGTTTQQAAAPVEQAPTAQVEQKTAPQEQIEPKLPDEPNLLSTNTENNLLSQNEVNDFSGLKTPEDSYYTDNDLNSLKVFAAENGFSPAQAQALLEREHSNLNKVKETLNQDWETTQNEWKQSLKEDKDYGGTNINRTLRLAKTTLDKFGNPELTKLLEDGVQHNPGIIKLLADVAVAISEDTSIQKSTQTPKDVRQADIMFG